MSKSLPSSHFTIPLASIVGLVAVGGGVQSLVDPEAFSHTIGLPVSAESAAAAAPYCSFAGARNLSSGLAVLTLLYTRQTKSTAVVLASGAVTALVDAWICYHNAATKAKYLGHLFAGTVMAGLAGALY